MRWRLVWLVSAFVFAGSLGGCRDEVAFPPDVGMPVALAPALIPDESDDFDDDDFELGVGAEDEAIADDSSTEPLFPLPTKPFDAENPRQALLIGCSRYDFLPASAQLRGPVNDVVMMRELLMDRFGFPAENITVLAERLGDDLRPLKENIQREFKRLAERAKTGSQVVVYFSGHGAQQPNDNPDDPDDPEPDGLDEILCAADTRPDFDIEKFRVPNAVSDDELRAWLNAIRSRGGSVWAIIDACHSGTATRGTETYRQVPAELLVPRDWLQKATARAGGATRGVSADSSSFDVDESAGGIVAIYAAQPHEPTIELPLPIDAVDRQWRGLLTYNLAKVLTQSKEPVTYTELVQRIHAEYIAKLGRLGPVPLVEGTDRNREVLGTTEWPDRSRVVLQVDKRGRLKINAGRLHGLTPGTILSALPPAGSAADDRPLGYVRITRAGMTDSDAEPCAFDDLDAPRELPSGARCQMARRDYGDLRLRVAIDAPKVDPSAPVDPWRQQIARRAEQPGAVFELTEDPARAQWLIRPIEGNRAVLLPAAGWASPPGIETAAVFGPRTIDDGFDGWLYDQLSRIARAGNILKIAGEMAGERQSMWSNLIGKKNSDLQVEFIELKSTGDERGRPLEWRRGGLQLEEGALVALRLHNGGSEAVDFTVLFLDSGYGIEAVYPSSTTVVDNRLEPDGSFTVGPLAINAESVGLEHLIVIAVKADGQPVDFTWLAQPSLEKARSASSTRGGRDNSDNPLGGLFQQALFGAGRTRGLKTATAGNVAMQAISWQSLPRDRAP